MKKLFFNLLIIIFLSSFTVNQAYACAVGSISPQDAFKGSDVVFVGAIEGCFEENGESFTRYKVHTLWKGEIKETYSFLVTPQCYHDLLKPLIGKKTLIYANYKENSNYLEREFSLCPRGGVLEPAWKRMYYDLLSEVTGHEYGIYDIKYFGNSIKKFK